MDEKKIKLEKDLYKVEDGRVYIESEELANAIQEGNLDLFIDEEYNDIFTNCLFSNCGKKDDTTKTTTTTSLEAN